MEDKEENSWAFDPSGKVNQEGHRQPIQGNPPQAQPEIRFGRGQVSFQPAFNQEKTQVVNQEGCTGDEQRLEGNLDVENRLDGQGDEKNTCACHPTQADQPAKAFDPLGFNQ